MARATRAPRASAATKKTDDKTRAAAGQKAKPATKSSGKTALATASAKAASAPPSPDFAGFVPETLKFLKALGFHQTREWFEANRALYLSAFKEPLEAYVSAFSASCEARGLALRGDPKRSTFRLNRDVRFSKDKSPYKSNGGCVLTRTAQKNSPGLVYTHLSPDGCFFAAGFYHPEPEQLAAFRRVIAAKPDAFVALRDRLAQHTLILSDREALTRNPRDFADVDARVADAVRMRNFIVRRPFDDALLLDGGALVKAATDFAAQATPLLEWGWKIVR